MNTHGMLSRAEMDELERDGVDGVPTGEFGACHVQPLFQLKDDHRGADDRCDVCNYVSSTGADGYRCYGSLPPIPESVIDDWVRNGAPGRDFDEVEWNPGSHARWQDQWALDEDKRKAEWLSRDLEAK